MKTSKFFLIFDLERWDQIPDDPFPRLSTTPLPLETLSAGTPLPDELTFGSMSPCGLPFLRMNSTTSTSLCVPKIVSSCCFDGVFCSPCTPCPVWYTLNAEKCVDQMKKRATTRDPHSTTSTKGMELIKLSVWSKENKKFCITCLQADC